MTLNITKADIGRNVIARSGGVYKIIEDDEDSWNPIYVEYVSGPKEDGESGRRHISRDGTEEDGNFVATHFEDSLIGKKFKANNGSCMEWEVIQNIPAMGKNWYVLRVVHYSTFAGLYFYDAEKGEFNLGSNAFDERFRKLSPVEDPAKTKLLKEIKAMEAKLEEHKKTVEGMK